MKDEKSFAPQIQEEQSNISGKRNCVSEWMMDGYALPRNKTSS